MPRNLPPPGFVTAAEFARLMGVSRSAVSQAMKSGRLQAYDGKGRPLDGDGGPLKAISRRAGAPRTGEVPAPAMGGECRMKIEGPRFNFGFAPDISDEKWAEMCHVVCKVIVCGRPQSPKRRRQIAI